MKPQEKTLAERNNIGVKYNLVNNLGFNLCVAPQSLVMRLVTYFRVEKSHQKEVLMK